MGGVDPQPPTTTTEQTGQTDPTILPRSDVRETDQLYAYRQNGEYAAVLKDCALIENASEACVLQTLPFIAQAQPDFTREDILERLLVTHDWMGRRFEQLLNDAPDRMISLFGSITSISIGSTVRPSYYWGGTGGIQLDPEGLWLSLSEKSNVATVEDYRSNFGDDLQFWFFETLRNGNEAAINYYNLTDYRERAYEEIKIPMYRLLYHELAHAVDYLPRESIPTLDLSLVPGEALFNSQELFVSPRLYNDLPLYSETLFALGNVNFRGADPTEDQKSFLPSFLGSEMGNDGAARYYGYSTEREDFATLFATSMMKMDFNLDFHVAFVGKPANLESYYCNELLVGWGQRNRLADPLVSSRAKWVLEQVYGSSAEIDSFFTQSIGTADPMTEGVDWCSNRDATSQLADFPVQQSSSDALNRAGSPSESLKLQIEQLEFERRVRLH